MSDSLNAHVKENTGLGKPVIMRISSQHVRRTTSTRSINTGMTPCLSPVHRTRIALRLGQVEHPPAPRTSRPLKHHSLRRSSGRARVSRCPSNIVDSARAHAVHLRDCAFSRLAAGALDCGLFDLQVLPPRCERVAEEARTWERLDESNKPLGKAGALHG